MASKAKKIRRAKSRKLSRAIQARSKAAQSQARAPINSASLLPTVNING